MPYYVHRVFSRSRVVVAGPFALQSDADANVTSLSVGDPGVRYETVLEGAGAALQADGVAVGAMIAGQAVSTSSDPIAPDVASASSNPDPVSLP